MPIPDSHADLLDRPLDAALATRFAGGRIQLSVVWFWRDGGDVRLTTMAEFAKAKNLRERPRTTLLVWDADGRWLELRCSAQEVPQPPEAARADLDDVGFRYCGVRPYFGAVVPAEWAGREHPVTFRLTPHAVTAGTHHWGVESPAVAPAGVTAVDDEPTAAASDVDLGSPAAEGELELPDDHRDLLVGGAVRLLATRDPRGDARVVPVACGLVGGRAALEVGAAQAGDLARDPRATLLLVDPDDSARWMEVRADVADVHGGRALLAARRVVLDAVHP